MTCLDDLRMLFAAEHMIVGLATLAFRDDRSVT